MNWAAITYTLLLLASFAVAMVQSGQPRKPHTAAEAFAALAIALVLLWQAGFFQ